jgi:hypothetical protein
MPPIAPAVLLIIQGIQAAIAVAPAVEDIVIKGKALIDSFFTAKLINSDQQNAVHAHLDSLWAMAQSGIILPHWQVEADPTN